MRSKKGWPSKFDRLSIFLFPRIYLKFSSKMIDSIRKAEKAAISSLDAMIAEKKAKLFGEIKLDELSKRTK